MVAAASGVVEQRRREALDRLGVGADTPEPWFAQSVELVADAVGAAAAAITFVDDVRAWCYAATPGALPDVARAASLAGRALAAPDGRVTGVVAAGDALCDHPLVAAVPLPAAHAAVVVRGPNGDAIGALEVIWQGDDPPAPDRVDLVARFARAVSHVLELHADVREYRRFIDISPDAMAVLDHDGAVELANPALATLLGYTGAVELTGRTFLELVAAHDQARVTAELSRALFAPRGPSQLDFELLGTTGDTVPCSVSVGHLRGARRRLQLVIRDLTSRVRAEEEHSRLSEQLARAQRLDAVAQVATGLAHDLNNLLVVMASNLSLADESLDKARRAAGDAALAPVTEDLGEIRLAVDRAVDLTGKLLDFARRKDGELEAADVVEVARRVQRLVGRTLPADVTLTLDLGPSLPKAAVDPVQLERALVNLVMNARDAVGSAGTISIDANVDGPCLRIAVADDGCGMDNTTRARAFEPLFTTKGSAGSGLGLATVLALADDVDGTVELDSKPGQGTIVALQLPLADQVEAAVPVGADVPVGGARVVLVEPGERTSRVITEMLRGAGYRVRPVTTAADAQAELERSGADLLMTELSLPGVPGDRLVEAVQVSHPDLPVIALTGFDAPATVDGIPVLVKPFSHSRLLRMVERVVPAP